MKSKLAIFGGSKTINVKGPQYTWPIINKEMEIAVKKQLYKDISIYDRSGIIKEVEDELAKYYGRKHALLVNSGTMAIYSMFFSINLKQGDEVIFPNYNFFASVLPVLFTGASPVLCDSNPIDGNIDPEKIEALITDKTRAISVTHMWGMPCDMDKIMRIAKKYAIEVLEDFSHAHGAEFRNKKIGSFGAASAASLQGQKIITGGEGGVLLTDDDEIYYKALLLGHYNKRSVQEIPKENRLAKFAVTGMGLKLRIHPLAAAIIKQQMKHVNDWLKIKRQIAEKMTRELKDVKGILSPEVPSYKKPAWYAYIIRYNKDELEDVPIETFYNALLAEGASEADIPHSTGILNQYPIFQNPKELFNYYKGPRYKLGDFPVSEKFYRSIIKLPVWAEKKDMKFAKLYPAAIKKVVDNIDYLKKKV
ncbi:MAG: DegT/DnrJ/EryC1/StrS family aminotransferase [Candidatus Parvarchaeum sp.]